jgi:hypothetical protein
MSGKLIQPYIYCYYDKLRKRVIYVGKTNGRRESYKTGSKILKRFIKIFGFTNFDNRFDRRVIEECGNDILNEREEYWVKYYKTYISGVNLTKGGKFDWNRQNLKPVLQYDLGGNFIQEWRCGLDACIKLKSNNVDAVSACCLGKQRTALGFIWEFKTEKIKKNIKPGARKEYKKGVKRTKNQKIQIEGKTYKSITQASRGLKWSFGKLNYKIKNNQIKYKWIN